MIKIKRIYEPYSPDDGYRLLVDRLWPRGIAKAHARIDLWMKDVAPSTTLRKWFSHDPLKWQQFRRRYLAELQVSPAYAELKALAGKHAVVTLLYAARDEAHNEARVLQELLSSHH